MRALVIAAALVCLPATAGAQAWGPPAGAGAVTLAYQNIDHTGHRLADGTYVDNGRSRTSALFLSAEYGLTRRLSITAGIPLVFAKYTDQNPPPPLIPFLDVDACRCWHHGWQDVSVTARLAAVDTFDHVLGIAPSVTVSVPSHAYAYRGEAVIGRQLTEVRLAVDAGRRLDEISRRLTVSGLYSYSVVERVLGLRNDRSQAEVALHAQLGAPLLVRTAVMLQRTHGGLRTGTGPENPFGDVDTPDKLFEHDRLLRDNRVHLAVGLSYRMAPGTLFVEFTHFLSGTDTHAGRALTTGISVPFQLAR